MPACTVRHSQVSKFFFFCIWTFLPGQVGRDTTQITAWVDGGSSRRCPTHCFRRHSLLRISLHPDFIGNPPKILHLCTSLEVLYVSLFLTRNHIYCQIFCNKCIICAKHKIFIDVVAPARPGLLLLGQVSIPNVCTNFYFWYNCRGTGGTLLLDFNNEVPHRKTLFEYRSPQSLVWIEES